MDEVFLLFVVYLIIFFYIYFFLFNNVFVGMDMWVMLFFDDYSWS